MKEKTIYNLCRKEFNNHSYYQNTIIKELKLQIFKITNRIIMIFKCLRDFRRRLR